MVLPFSVPGYLGARSRRSLPLSAATFSAVALRIPSLFHKLRAPAVGRSNRNNNGKNNHNRKGTFARPSFTL